MKIYLLLVLALWASAAAATAGDFDFFPQDHSSEPSAWSHDNQTAYSDTLASAAALDNGAAGLLTVAVRSYSDGEPTFFFKPGAVCEVAGATVPLAKLQALVPDAAAASRGPARRPASSRRALLQTTTTTTTPNAVVVARPCTLARITYAIDGAAPVTLEASDGAAGVYQFTLPADLPDGQHCVALSATYNTDAATFQTTPDYTAALGATLPDALAFKRTVCLLKLNAQATADVAFDMCATNQFTVNISSFAPLPVNVTLNGAPVGGGAPLVRPLIKVYGVRVSGLDGTPVEAAYDPSSGDGENWVSKFVALPSSYDGSAVAAALSPSLAEGYYSLSAVASLVTDYPRLVNLSGLNRIEQDDVTGAEAGVSGLYEAAAQVLLQGALIGLQRASTPTVLSVIACTSHAPKQNVTVGDNVTLTWKFDGAGSATCTHDGAPASNAPNGACVSPLTVVALPPSAAASATPHRVVVTFADACGRRRTAEWTYAQAGVTAVTPTEVLNADGTVSIVGAVGTGPTVIRTNAAAARHALKSLLGAGTLLAATFL